MKKQTKLIMALLILVGLMGGILLMTHEKSLPKQEVTDNSPVNKIGYDEALKAIETAEGSLTDEDIKTAQELVDKVTYRKSYLTDKLKAVILAKPWKALDELIITGEKNPTDEAITAAQAKYNELDANPDTTKYGNKKLYLNRIYALHLKKLEKIVALAESSRTKADVETAYNLINTLTPMIEVWNQEDSRTNYLMEQRNALVLRYNQITATHNETPTEQATAQGNSGNTDGDVGTYTPNESQTYPQTASSPTSQTPFSNNETPSSLIAGFNPCEYMWSESPIVPLADEIRNYVLANCPQNYRP